MADFYERRIINADAVEIRHALSDPLGGIVIADTVTLELSNVDQFFNGQDLRGQLVALTRFDRLDSESALEFTGSVTEQTIKDDRAILRMISQDQNILQTLIPKHIVTTSTFPLAHATEGVGRPVPLVFGSVVSPYPLPYVTDNTSSNVYDYLIGEGSSYTNAVLYRDTNGAILSLVNSTEYTLNTTSYAGYTVARFPLRQAKFGGGLHTIHAAVTGMQPESNFARAIRTLMTNSVWGLNQVVDNVSFSSVESLLASVGSLACGAALIKSRPAIDLLNQLLMVRGMTLSKTTGNAWTLAIDQGSSSATYQANFGHGAGQPWNNVTVFNGLTRTPVREAISMLDLDYALEYKSGNYRNTVTRSVLSIGRERRVTNEFIQTGVTADLTVDYLSKRLIQGDQKASFSAGQEARNLQVGNLILYTAPQLGVSSLGLRITEIRRRLDITQIVAEGWASSIYSYTAANSIPADITAPVESLWSVTTPSAVTSLSIVGSGIVADGQGGWAAYQTLQYNVASESFAQTFVRQRITTTSGWITAAVNPTQGSSLQTRIDGLITGQYYDFTVDRVNIFNPALFATTLITSIQAPKDTTAPAAPGTPTIFDQHLKTITFAWTAPADQDVAGYYYDLRTGANGTGTVVTTGTVMGGRTVTLTLNQIAYGSTNYFRVSAQDYSGNGGASGNFSPSVAFSFTQVGAGDLGSGSVTNPAVGTGAIGTGNIIINAITTNAAGISDVGINLTTTEATILSTSISTSGGFVEVVAKVYVRILAGYEVTLNLRKDSLTGTLIDSVLVGFPSGSTGQNMEIPAVLVAIDNNPSSTQVYYFTGQVTNGVGTIGVYMSKLVIENLKR